MTKENYIVASFSGGKDSTAMVLRMIELEEHIDEVIFCDTYKEFRAMYKHIEKVKNVVEGTGIKFTTLKNEKSFDYFMFEHQKKGVGENEKKAGYSWADFKSRWCTRAMKIQVINTYLKKLNENYRVTQLVGIATDEQHRIKGKLADTKKHRFPLIECGWTEKDALNYCYSKGYDWDGLYQIFRRVSCWCCPLQSLDDLRNLREFFPDLWRELGEMDKKTWRKFRADFSVAELEVRFQLEEEMKRQGKSIFNKEFFCELRKRIEEMEEVKE